MLSKLVLLSNIFLIAWLFVRDRKLRPMPSKASWIALLWIVIIGSRYLSGWLGLNLELDSPEELVEGSPLDRSIFLILIVSAAVALLLRKPIWAKVINMNRWYFAFFIYCGISIIWSDYPFVSLKRYIKEIGNVLMVLLILTEKDPVQTVRVVFARYVHLVIPLSVLLIYSIPSLGMYYDDNMLPSYCGVATNKNKLGVITFVSVLFLIWEIIYFRDADGKNRHCSDTFGNWVLLLLAGWLIYIAHSATALVCVIVGAFLLLLMKLPFVVKHLSYLGFCSLLASITIIFAMYRFPEGVGLVAEGLGRDSTFTGRTELWMDLMREPVNPLVGTGYQSFWLGSRADNLWDKYLFHPIQAHNGYLETYLNGGVVGVGLLLAMIVATGGKLKRVLLIERSFGILLVVFIITATLYNCTEAMISRLSLLWFVITIAALYSPTTPEFNADAAVRPL
jgi:O-antigen ligase